MTPKEKISTAASRTMYRQIFFASLIASTPYVISSARSTAWTDYRKIYFNPDFVDKQTANKTEGLLVHEVLHIKLMHKVRQGWRKPLIWNVACDHVINLAVTETYEIPDGGCCNPKYKGMHEEAVYDELVREEQERMAAASGKDGKPKSMPTTAEAEQSLEDRLTQQLEGLSLDISGGGEETGAGGEDGETQPLSESEIATLRTEMMAQLAQAATMARAAGQLPAGMDRLLQDLMEPQVPWHSLLRRYACDVAHDAEDWGRPNRRVRDVFLPRIRSEAMGELTLIVDTSGSITDVELAQVAAEMQAIAEDVKPARIRIVWADAQIAGEQLFDRSEPLMLEPKGGGGTDMRIPLAYVEQFEQAVVILCTDGHTPWPKGHIPYPLIVCCTTDQDVPIGEVIRMRA